MKIDCCTPLVFLRLPRPSCPKQQQSPLPQSPARQSISLDAAGFLQISQSVRRKPSGIPVPPIQTRRTPPTPPQARAEAVQEILPSVARPRQPRQRAPQRCPRTMPVLLPSLCSSASPRRSSRSLRNFPCIRFHAAIRRHALCDPSALSLSPRYDFLLLHPAYNRP